MRRLALPGLRSRIGVRLALVLAVTTAGLACGDRASSTDAGAGPRSTRPVAAPTLPPSAAPVSTSTAPSPAPGATSAPTKSPFPPFARRTTPPPAIETSAVAVGARAPALVLATADGTRFSLEEARRDGPVVVVFYRGFWWPYCRTQLGELQRSLEAFRSRHATLVAVSVDTPQDNSGLAARIGTTFPLLADPEREATRAWGVLDAQNDIAWPAIFVVGRDGRVTWRSLAETYRERPASQVVLDVLPSP